MILKELLGLLEAKKSMSSLVDSWIGTQRSSSHSPELLAGLASKLGYRDVDYFFSDNPGALETMLEWIGEQDASDWKQALFDEDDEDDLYDLDLSELIDKWTDRKKSWSFEGSRGVQNFENLVREFGYRDMNSFLEDNPGAVEAIFNWVGTQRAPEWIEALSTSVSEQLITEAVTHTQRNLLKTVNDFGDASENPVMVKAVKRALAEFGKSIPEDKIYAYDSDNDQKKFVQVLKSIGVTVSQIEDLEFGPALSEIKLAGFTKLAVIQGDILSRKGNVIMISGDSPTMIFVDPSQS